MVDGKSVFYYQQMKVLFEKEYLHWRMQDALDELVEEGEINIIESSRKGKYLYRYGVRYFRKKFKELKTLVGWISEQPLERGCGKWAEHLAGDIFKELNFKIITSHSNKYKNKVYSNTKHNLDFILERNGYAYGVEVKNRFSYIPQKEFEIKMYDMCNHLGLIPILVARCAPQNYIDDLRKAGGYTIMFKRKAFPYGFELGVKKYWLNTMLPVGVTDMLITPRFLKNFIKWLK